jgi:glycosyltransferase involved in cell wall biosynthesis
MVRLSCSVKLHSFYLAEQLDKRGLLDKFYTVYHSRKDRITALFNHRRDLEQIHLDKLKTFPFIAPLIRFGNPPYINNQIFDNLVARDLVKSNGSYNTFVGWSGMSIASIRQAKDEGKSVILERGSSHIRYQFSLLEDEYKRWSFRFHGDPRVADQEEQEYALADYVVVPSRFVEKTFLEKGFPAEKIFRNNFGVSRHFNPSKPKRGRFTVAYVGNLSIRKGLPYLFQALSELKLDRNLYEVWFIGHIDAEIKTLIPRFQQNNWKFFGFINHYELANLMSQCSIAVQPSLEEGMSMVIPQLMACGTPVIATTNTGGEDFITDGVNGFIIPIRRICEEIWDVGPIW